MLFLKRLDDFAIIHINQPELDPDFESIKTLSFVCFRLIIGKGLLFDRRTSQVTRRPSKMIRMEVDYSSTVEEKIPECEKLAKVGAIRFGLMPETGVIRKLTTLPRPVDG